MASRLGPIAGVALGLVAFAPAAAGETKFRTEAAATGFCGAGSVVWVNPNSRFYFESASRFYGKSGRNAGGGFTCRAVAASWGFRLNRQN